MFTRFLVGFSLFSNIRVAFIRTIYVSHNIEIGLVTAPLHPYRRTSSNTNNNNYSDIVVVDITASVETRLVKGNI